MQLQDTMGTRAPHEALCGALALDTTSLSTVTRDPQHNFTVAPSSYPLPHAWENKLSDSEKLT